MNTHSCLLPTLALGLLALTPLSVRAIVISDDFSSYTASDTTNLSGTSSGQLGHSNGFGPIGAGWLRGWRSSSNNTGGTTSAYVLDTNPLLVGGNYFSYTVTTVAGNGVATSSLLRPYDATGVSVGGTTAFSTRFDFRADSVTGSVRFNLSNSNSRTASYDGTATWVLSAYDGYWYAGNGAGDNFVSTGLAFETGVTYSIAIHENPETLRWSVSISDGATSRTLTDLNFRTSVWATGGGDSIADSRWLTFAAAEVFSGTSVGASATFSVDNIQISTVPEPAAVALIFGAAIIGFAALRRRWQ
ncbi:hypothetical protein OPIT5_25835 [Opitutaceae bacterium TAV5]|nr:hypothetical protein OPIT5_25835 [Opitutaceae bacterium TAV5]